MRGGLRVHSQDLAVSRRLIQRRARAFQILSHVLVIKPSLSAAQPHRGVEAGSFALSDCYRTNSAPTTKTCSVVEVDVVGVLISLQAGVKANAHWFNVDLKIRSH
jgi:hypothetical protein